MSRRDGVTLMEVLVAIFVMGIGMLALLVLFPVGVLSMATAIQNEQCSQAARNGTAIASMMGVRNDPWVLNDTTAVLGGFSAPGDPFVNPWPLNSGMLPADPDRASFPVFVDPMGYGAALGANNQYWLGLTNNNNTIPRRTTTYATLPGPLVNGVPTRLPANTGSIVRWTCLLDGLPFTPEAVIQYDLPPNPPVTSGTFSRDIRFCWAYMLKRPRTSDLSVVDMSVIVFNNDRPILTSTLNEYVYQSDGNVNEVAFNPAERMITIDVSQSLNVVPTARPGDWLLDASYIPNPAGTFATVNGNFYRVVNVTENSESSYTFEVERPLRNMEATTALNPATGVPYATQKIIILEGVAEVFEKGPGWKSSP